MNDPPSLRGAPLQPSDEPRTVDSAGHPSRTRWSDPAFVVAALTLAGFLFYAILRTAVARFYGPLGVTADEVDATYPGLLAVSATTLGVLLSLTAALVATFLLYGWMVAWCFTQGLADDNRIVRILLPTAGTAFAVFVLLVGWDTGGLLLAGLFAAGILLMAVRTIISWRAVVAAALGIVVLAFGADLLDVASSDASLVRTGYPVDGSGQISATRPWAVTIAMVDWHGEIPPSLQHVRLGCVLVLGSLHDRTLVYATDDNGIRRTFVVRPEDALVQRVPDAQFCPDWPTRNKRPERRLER
jgi:hypothetical protein